MSCKRNTGNGQDETCTSDDPSGLSSNGDEEPRVLAIRRLHQPFSRRALMGGMASAASALAVGAASKTAGADTQRESKTHDRTGRRDQSVGDAHVAVDVRAFSEGIRAVYPLGDGNHVAAVSDAGQLRVWHLDRPSAPVEIGRIQSVRSVVTGLLDELIWMSGTAIHFRRMANPSRDVWSRKEKGVERLLTIATDRLVLLNNERELVQLGLADGERIGASLVLPAQVDIPDQVVAGSDGTLWLTGSGKLYRRRKGGDWEQVLETEKSNILRLDPLAERMLIEGGDIAQVVKLPELMAIGPATVLPAADGDLRPVGAYSPLKRRQSKAVFDPWLRSRAEIAPDGKSASVRSLDGRDPGHRVDLGPSQARTMAGVPPRGYVWGDSEGRMGVVGGPQLEHSGGRARSGIAGGGASTTGGGIPLGAPGASVSSKGAGAWSGGTWAGNACACNTVSVHAGESGRTYSIWDKVTGRWTHRTVPASEKLPEGAVCTCNTVALGEGDFFRTICSCNRVCTCEHVCTCEQVCSCDQVCVCEHVCSCNNHSYSYSSHYWRPN